MILGPQAQQEGQRGILRLQSSIMAKSTHGVELTEAI
jgi:hypothetical protein